MKYLFFLSGLLISLTIGVVLTGQQLIAAKSEAIKSEIQAKLVATKLAEAQALQESEKNKAANTVIIKKSN